MATERAALATETLRVQAGTFRLRQEQDASNAARQHPGRPLPTGLHGRRLFQIPEGATPVQPQRPVTPAGHCATPLDNMIEAAARLAAIPIEGESPTAVETRRARDLLQTALEQQHEYSQSRDRDLLQTAMVQQQAYSYNHDRIHSTPRPSRSYSRHMDSVAVSSNVKRRDQPGGLNPARHEAVNLVDQDRI